MHTAALPAFLDAEHLISTFGLVGLLVILFAECGLLIGFFLPGDTLLFSAGLLVATGVFHVSIWVLVVLLPAAAILGNLVGYWIGYRAGPAVFNRPDSRLFRQEYVERSHAFFERYGVRTVVLARFVPIVRTFATVMAGASRMRFRTYAVFSVLGGVLWSAGLVLLGYYLGHIQFVQDKVRPLIEPVIAAVVILSLVPAAVEVLRRRRRGGRTAAGAMAPTHAGATPPDPMHPTHAGTTPDARDRQHVGEVHGGHRAGGRPPHVPRHRR